MTISYRQLLLRSNEQARLFYLPEFHGLPKSAATTNKLYYSITVRTSSDCALTGSNGEDTFALKPEESITLSPRHLQPLRALVKPQSDATPRGAAGGVRN